MLSITTAARRLGLPRDMVLNAVRSGVLPAQRDRRGILRIEPGALARYAITMPRSPARETVGNLVFLDAMRLDRLPLVLAQQERQEQALLAATAKQAEDETLRRLA